MNPGTVLQNRYEIIHKIAEGGMGAVYLAEDKRLNHRVALKETFFKDAELRQQFAREACFLANLRHPALVVVTDHFDEHESQFLVMQYIPGDDLGILLEKRTQPFSIHDICLWTHQLLDALKYLHSQPTPIVHRDIKPRNIKLSERNDIVLLDFGLAKGIALKGETSVPVKSIQGYTLNYAPQEQISGKGTDGRSDLYSLGATLYHLITGHSPVDAISRLNKRSAGEPDPLMPPDHYNHDVPARMSALIMRAMALLPDDRPRNAADMHAEFLEASRFFMGEAGDNRATVISPPAPAMKIPMFISTISPHEERQTKFLDDLFRCLEKIGINPVHFKPTQFDRRDPFGAVRKQLEACRGVIVVGLERTHVYFSRDKEGTEKQTEEIHRKYTSGWLHLEAGMANALNMDIFVVCQKDLCSDGIFDRWWNSYPILELTNLDCNSPEMEEFLAHLREWVGVQTRLMTS